jgi:hypothetical protein
MTEVSAFGENFVAAEFGQIVDDTIVMPSFMLKQIYVDRKPKSLSPNLNATRKFRCPFIYREGISDISRW